MVKTREQDHIDRFLEEVKVRFPDLDLRVEGIVDRIGGIQRRIRRMLDETLEEHGLNAGEWHLLGSLTRAPELPALTAPGSETLTNIVAPGRFLLSEM